MSNLKKYYFIYKTTNVLTNKYYYGMHSTSNLDDGYLGSGKRLRYSIRKYGEENHIREIIEFVNDVEELKKREAEIVNLNEIAKVDCMNIITGGFGGFTNEQQKLNAQKSKVAQKILRETNPDWVKQKSEKQSISQKKLYENGTRKKGIFYDWTGKKHKEKSKRLIGEKNSIHQTGSRNSQYGTMWITNGKYNKKIKREDKIPDKWKRGRVIKK